MMTKEQFKNILAGLISNYPGLKIDNAAQFNFWYESLKDIDYELCQIGVMKMVQTLKFTPTIASIREACTLDNTPTVTEAWDEVMSCVKGYGSYREVDALESMEPITRRVVESMGYRNICMSENIMAERAHFIKLYDQMAIRERQDNLLPNGLREQLKLASDKLSIKRLEASDV